jgi:CheY-like chemotaxis protein
MPKIRTIEPTGSEWAGFVLKVGPYMEAHLVFRQHLDARNDDMMMPIMNGRDFMSAFAKRSHTLVPIPVYLVSASALEGESKQMGCDGFLKKPFSIDALLAIVHMHCKIQDKQRLD